MTLSPKTRLVTVIAFTLMSLQAAALPMEDLISQTEILPEDFSSHFFNAPLMTRIELDGQYLGDAMILLSTEKTVQLINFIQSSESQFPPATRSRWAQALSKPVSLGSCDKQCPQGLVSLYYNLVNTTLSIATTEALAVQDEQRHVALPEGGSSGLILRNQLNLIGGEQQPWSGSQNLNLESSLGNWTGIAAGQLSRSDIENSQTEARVNSLFVQREYPDQVLRAGLFQPDSQGILRQPNMPGGSSVQTVAGAMLASSDTLLIQTGQASLYPVMVTANRDSVAEIFRDGVLINSQPVAPGLQQLDTTVLPGGIYDVEVRIVEAGTEISRSTETIYKPSNWRNPNKRWQYSAYAGIEQQLGNSRYKNNEGEPALGASVNYMAHPKVVLGAAAQHAAEGKQYGVSADVQAAENIQLYGSAGSSDRWGSRYDTQLNWKLGQQTNLMFNHNQSWYKESNSRNSPGRQQNSSATINQRLGNGDSLSLRGTHYSRENGVGVDATWRTRMKIKDTPVTLSLNAYDRPYMQGDQKRNRGASLNLSFALGGENRSVSASLGSRNDNKGERDLFASASVSQSFEESMFKDVSAGVTGDKFGVSTNLYTRFEGLYASGTAYANHSSQGKAFSGGLNMNNTLAVGGGKVSVSHSPDAYGNKTGIIVDVESDDPDVRLKTRDSQGGSSTLRAGRNFIPTTAYKPGQLQIDFDGRDAPPLKIWPAELPYHLNKGGVAHSKVRVMKTLTLIGRVLDDDGTPLSGAKLVNHAGQGITENDGFFIMDMHEHTPEVVVHARDKELCSVKFDLKDYKRENDTLMIGDFSCKRNTKS